MGLCCVIIQEAATSPLVAQVTPAWLARCASAVQTQLSRDVAPIYGGTYGIRVGSGPTDVLPGEMVFSIVDSLPDAPGAVAYHDVNGTEVPVALLALSTCSTLDDVSTAISHEMCETAGDAQCDLWADDGNGSEWARELCDAVESNSYPVDMGDGGPPIAVSDFLLPAFFGTGAPAPYNYMASISPPQGNPPSAPFATAGGGYQIKRDSGANETQVQGHRKARLEGTPRSIRAAKVAHWSSRVSRRGVK